MESIFRNEAWDHMLEPLSEENEKMICETMIGGCVDALKPYKSISAFSPDGCSPAQKLASQVSFPSLDFTPENSPASRVWSLSALFTKWIRFARYVVQKKKHWNGHWNGSKIERELSTSWSFMPRKG